MYLLDNIIRKGKLP